MQQAPFTTDVLGQSVIAVPPLARRSDLSLAHAENARLIGHLEAGGVSTLLYGGNANFYHLPLSEYAPLLEWLAEHTSPAIRVIPAAGPAFGTMMDQCAHPSFAPLPHGNAFATRRHEHVCRGVERGVRQFVEEFGRPVIVYLKREGFLEPQAVARLANDGLLSAVKYAIVRDDPSHDETLRQLVETVDPRMIVSGMGEQPAIVHWRKFGLRGFTSGCVTIAPHVSMRMLRALQDEDYATAEQLRLTMKPLEDLRDSLHPIRVLHDAVALAGIAETGPILPLLDNLPNELHRDVQRAAQQLLEENHA